VALDLETTGLSPESDEVIEVGAVKFKGAETVDTFQAFVNPNRSLTPFIKRLTNITQKDVDAAPPFSRVAGELAAFLGDAPIVGHNVAFDIGFLTAKGLRLSNPRADTWDLAYVMLPDCPDYTLAGLAVQLGASHDSPHRALDDAIATRDVFLALAGMAAELDVYTLAEMDRLATRSGWVLSYLLRRLEAYKVAAGGSAQKATSGPGMTGLDLTTLRGRLKHRKALRPNKGFEPVDRDLVGSLLSADGPLVEVMPGFEERPEQVAMARAIAEAVTEASPSPTCCPRRCTRSRITPGSWSPPTRLTCKSSFSRRTCPLWSRPSHRWTAWT
jgi:DNA polymerase III epsilon subunit family exonuclease